MPWVRSQQQQKFSQMKDERDQTEQIIEVWTGRKGHNIESAIHGII